MDKEIKSGTTPKGTGNMTHILRPWTVHYGEDYCTIYDANSDEVLTSPCYSDVDRGTFDLIVACVNACEGINPEAVPDLLNELKQLADTINDDIKDYPDSGPFRVLQSRLQKARAAIAKAGG